ncbi:hypothetical protein BLS_000275 [Venturia inaequalis]|uniref:UBC core domain-containing protein n=1 Tax=Venturia inaequalis TaxID=5025 RepID=A0A8H3V063_VENIN|nr:hypothetical protein BLS_000275 [Venturia inaequalis]
MAGSTKRIQKVKITPHISLDKYSKADIKNRSLRSARKTPQPGGHFTLHLTLPNNYPFKPPVLNFATKIYHPNISNDEKGSMCLGMLRPDEWKPPNRVLAVLELARSLLIEPLPDDAIETSIAEQYKNKRSEWEKEARSWTKRYAGGK